MSGHRKTLRRRQFDEAVESLLLDREESPQKNKLKMVHKALLREALQKGKDPDEVGGVCCCYNNWLSFPYLNQSINTTFSCTYMQEVTTTYIYAEHCLLNILIYVA